MIDLDPCPFCGHSKTVIDVDAKPPVLVCRNCGARGPEVQEKVTWTRSEDDYVRLAWNKRPQEQAMNARILTLERALRRAVNNVTKDNPLMEKRHKQYPWGSLWSIKEFIAWSDAQAEKENR